MLSTPLIFTMSYLMCGMFAVTWAYSQPGSIMSLEQMMNNYEIPPEVREPLKIMLTIFFVLFWPAMITNLPKGQ